MSTTFKNILSEKEHGFTLIEIIVVIIIVGILAAVGMVQYSKTVEKGRTAEAKSGIGAIRNLVYEYWLENGTTTGITTAAVNIGTSSDQFPSSCRSSHWYYYSHNLGAPPAVIIQALRCTSGGKSPNFSEAYYIEDYFTPETGGDSWYCWVLPDYTPCSYN